MAWCPCICGNISCMVSGSMCFSTMCMHAGSLETCAGLMNDSASVLAQRLGRAAEGGQTIDIWRVLGDLTMDVVGTAAFG